MSAPIEPIHHFVYVDFENVPTVNLEEMGESPVHVTLLIGEKQRRLELGLVRQIHRNAARVTLVEVGASGRNALDLVLACHLGQGIVQNPGAAFYIVSKDKDFDPLVSHLRATNVNASRHNAFAELPCFSARKPGSANPAPSSKLQKLIATLAGSNRSRPKRKNRLLAHINAFYGNALTEMEMHAAVDDLTRRGVLTVHPDGRVTYSRQTERDLG